MPLTREDSGAFAHITGAVDTVIPARALLGLIINQAGTTVSVYDNSAGTGSPIALLTTGVGSFLYNIRLNKGLHITTTGSPDITVAYR